MQQWRETGDFQHSMAKHTDPDGSLQELLTLKSRDGIHDYVGLFLVQQAIYILI